MTGTRTTTSDGRRRAELALVGVAAGWGLTFTLIQDATTALAPLAFVAYRFLLAAAALAVLCARQLRTLSPEGRRAALLLGLVLFVGYYTQTEGLTRTTASNAGFITGLYVVFTPLLGWLFLRQRQSGWLWCCVALASCGLLILSEFGGNWHGLGDVLILVCSVAFAVHILITDRVAPRFPLGPLVVVQLAVCGFAALLLAAGAGELTVPTGRPAWTALIFTALFASALAYLVQSYAQRRTSPARTSLILATEPVFAGLFGYVLAGDRLSWLAWTGAALMSLAVLATEWNPRVALRRFTATRPAAPGRAAEAQPGPAPSTESVAG